jgi:uncharacterized protein YoaH (UPF0181 family)
MSLKVKLEGGYADSHQISLDDIAVIAKSIQNISKNFEIKNGKNTYTTLYVDSTKKGSYEIIINLINDPYFQGLATTYLYDLAKDIKTFLKSEKKKEKIEKLINEIYLLALELAESDTYDYKYEQQQRLLEEKEKILSTEFSSFNSIKDINNLIREKEDEKSLKPTSISFELNEKVDTELLLTSESRKKIYEISDNVLELENIIVSGIPKNISRGTKSFFKMDVNFFGKLKIYIDEENLKIITEYFRKNESIKVEIKPILKIGELIKTREAKLINIIEG